MNKQDMHADLLLDTPIGEIVAADYDTAEVFKSFDLDFCCGGDKPLRQACEEKHINVQEVVDRLSTPLDRTMPVKSPRYQDWTPAFLIDFIINEHHNYTKAKLPELNDYLSRVCKVHGIQHPELKQIHWYFDKLREELELHMKFEEQKFFPLAKTFLTAETKKTHGVIQDMSHHLELMMDDHEETGRILDMIRKLSNNFTLPEDACTTYGVLYNGLDELEEDIKKHIHLENNILVPKVQRTLSELQQ